MSGDKDYTYDGNEAVTLSDSDSGANTATGLDGYSGDIDPNRNWPGITRNPKELIADPEAMRKVVKELKNLADKIREDPSVRNVESASSGVHLGPGDWGAANYLKAAGTQGAGIIAAGARQIAANLDLAAQAIKMAADSYDDADTTNQSGFDQ